MLKQGRGCYSDAPDYLMPRPKSILRQAIRVPDDDYVIVSVDHNSQCRNLLQRLPPMARTFIKKKGLMGKKGGPFSKGANGPPGPKD